MNVSHADTALHPGSQGQGLEEAQKCHLSQQGAPCTQHPLLGNSSPPGLTGSPSPARSLSPPLDMTNSGGVVLDPVHIQARTLFTPDSSSALPCTPPSLLLSFLQLIRFLLPPSQPQPHLKPSLSSFPSPPFPSLPSPGHTRTHNVFQTIQPFIFENSSAASAFFHKLRSGKKQKHRHCSPAPHLHPNLNRHRVFGRREGSLSHAVLAALPHTERISQSQGLREEPVQQTPGKKKLKELISLPPSQHRALPE